ncbi:MAG: hypothetical protein ACI80V_002962 [Rhodothermales bacterium]|jgi:hypothetical protein
MDIQRAASRERSRGALVSDERPFQQWEGGLPPGDGQGCRNDRRIKANAGKPHADQGRFSHQRSRDPIANLIKWTLVRSPRTAASYVSPRDVVAARCRPLLKDCPALVEIARDGGGFGRVVVWVCQPAILSCPQGGLNLPG